MRKIKKQHLFLPILLLSTSIVLMSCNTTTSSTKDSTSETKASYSEAKEELLNNWTTLLDSMETMYSQVHLVLDYAESFATNNTWDNLQKARSACSTIKINLNKLPIPEFTLTDKQKKLLKENGVDVDVVEYEYKDFTTELNLQLDTFATLEATLQNDVFFSSNVSVLDDWITANRNLLIDTSKYFCLLTNQLLLQLEETEFWEQIPEKYPHMAMGYTTWNEDSISLKQNATLVLDRYESRFIEMEKILGTSTYTLLLVEEAIQNGNLEHLINEMHTISEISTYCPEPEWFSENTAYYYLITDSKTKEKRMIQTKEEFTQTPSGCLIETPNVTKQEVEDYENCLKKWGLEPNIQWDADTQTYKIFALIGTSQILVTWTPEETSVYLTEPITCLIPELYLVALLNK